MGYEVASKFERKECLELDEMVSVYVLVGERGSVVIAPKFEEWYNRIVGDRKERDVASVGEQIFNRNGRKETVRSRFELELPLVIVGEREEMRPYLSFDDIGTFKKVLENCGHAAGKIEYDPLTESLATHCIKTSPHLDENSTEEV